MMNGTLVVAANYDTDDEDAVDLTKLPEFARELVIKLKTEEDEIESEDVDPILLTKIRPGSVRYEFVRPNGTKQVFRAESLIDYMLATCKFHDPETRIEFTDDQLKELDVLGAQLGKSSVYEAKIDGAWLKQKLEDDADAFNGVERCCGDYVYRMLRIIERTKKDNANKGEMELVAKCFPHYRHYATLLFNLDKDAAIVAMEQHKRFLCGPPNRPTHDRTKVLVRLCLDFISNLISELLLKDS